MWKKRQAMKQCKSFQSFWTMSTWVLTQFGHRLTDNIAAKLNLSCGPRIRLTFSCFHILATLYRICVLISYFWTSIVSYLLIAIAWVLFSSTSLNTFWLFFKSVNNCIFTHYPKISHIQMFLETSLVSILFLVV